MRNKKVSNRQGDESMDLSEYDRIIRIEYEF